jgi:hypothetical protein
VPATMHAWCTMCLTNQRAECRLMPLGATSGPRLSRPGRGCCGFGLRRQCAGCQCNQRFPLIAPSMPVISLTTSALRAGALAAHP